MWERYEEGGREEKRRVGGCEEDEMRAARIPDNKKKATQRKALTNYTLTRGKERRKERRGEKRIGKTKANKGCLDKRSEREKP